MATFNNAYNEQITLTEEQERCLNYHLGEKTLMVKGYAGAGKSVVLQTTALKYINMYPVGKREHKIGVFTYTNALTTTTRELLDANQGGKDVYTSTLDRYMYDVYKAMGGPSRKIYWGKIRQDNIKQALEMHENKYGHHRFHNLDVQFWEDEIDWMKGMNVSTDDMDYYLTLPRSGRGSVHMFAADRITAFQIYCCYCEVNEKKGCGDWNDFPIYINKRLQEYEKAVQKGKKISFPIPDELLFDMILIDEAQDLSLSQMLASMGLYRKAMIIAMDAHQRIYASNWSTKQLGIETQTQWLKKSMRNTVEIDALAESLRRNNDSIIKDNEKRAIPIRHGEKPLVVGLDDSSEEKTYVVNQVKEWLSESNTIRIAIIGATKKQVEKYSAWLSEQDIYHEIIGKDFTFSMKTPGVKILNAYNAKGLEFFKVIIPEFNEGYFPFSIKSDDQEEIDLLLAQFRSLAYVAMTRAQEMLVITYHGKKPSRYIGEFDSDLYVKKGSTGNSGYRTYSTRTQSNYDNSSRTRTSGSSVKSTTQSFSTTGGLKAFFEAKGFECIDKRGVNGGSLWIVGSRTELSPVVNEAKRLFGDLGNNNFAPNGGKATDRRAAWFITAQK